MIIFLPKCNMLLPSLSCYFWLFNEVSLISQQMRCNARTSSGMCVACQAHYRIVAAYTCTMLGRRHVDQLGALMTLARDAAAAAQLLCTALQTRHLGRPKFGPQLILFEISTQHSLHWYSFTACCPVWRAVFSRYLICPYAGFPKVAAMAVTALSASFDGSVNLRSWDDPGSATAGIRIKL
jgi:hypothetical protein